MTDTFRALCADLLWALENAISIIYGEGGTKHIDTANPIVERARAALAEPAPPDEGEVAELVEWLREIAQLWESDAPRAKQLFRAAELLERLAPQPVPVSERPWEREGWCDAKGWCWWFDGEDTGWVFDSPGAWTWALWSLPHHAIPQPSSLGDEEPKVTEDPLSRLAEPVGTVMTETTTPSCCEAWERWADSAAWFIDDEGIYRMPHLHGTHHRFNYCPSCGAERRSSIVVEKH